MKEGGKEGRKEGRKEKRKVRAISIEAKTQPVRGWGKCKRASPAAWRHMWKNIHPAPRHAGTSTNTYILPPLVHQHRYNCMVLPHPAYEP